MALDKTKVVYQIYPKSYKDTTGNGIGDFRAFGILSNRGGNLLHRGGSFFHAGGLFAGSLA